MKQNLLSIVEWAAKIGITQRTARRMVKDGRVKTFPLAVYITGIPAETKRPKK
jgi:predicted DNA-binding transcriptional regulator AlpA